MQDIKDMYQRIIDIMVEVSRCENEPTQEQLDLLRKIDETCKQFYECIFPRQLIPFPEVIREGMEQWEQF